MSNPSSVRGPEPCPCCKGFHYYSKQSVERMKEWADAQLAEWEPKKKCGDCGIVPNLYPGEGCGCIVKQPKEMRCDWCQIGSPCVSPEDSPCPCKCHKPNDPQEDIVENTVERCDKGCAGSRADVNCEEGRYCGCACHYGDAEFCVRWDREREWRKALISCLLKLHDGIDPGIQGVALDRIEALRNRSL